jgi:hypothetical protein
MLQDNWDTMSGVYMGKHLTSIDSIFNIAKIEDKYTCFRIIQILDTLRAKVLNSKKPAK